MIPLVNTPSVCVCMCVCVCGEGCLVAPADGPTDLHGHSVLLSCSWLYCTIDQEADQDQGSESADSLDVTVRTLFLMTRWYLTNGFCMAHVHLLRTWCSFVSLANVCRNACGNLLWLTSLLPLQYFLRTTMRLPRAFPNGPKWSIICWLMCVLRICFTG